MKLWTVDPSSRNALCRCWRAILSRLCPPAFSQKNINSIPRSLLCSPVGAGPLPDSELLSHDAFQPGLRASQSARIEDLSTLVAPIKFCHLMVRKGACPRSYCLRFPIPDLLSFRDHRRTTR